MLPQKNRLLVFLLLCSIVGSGTAHAQSIRRGTIKKGAYNVDIRSAGRAVADDTAQPRKLGHVVSPSALTLKPAFAPLITKVGGNVQVNDPNQDNIQIFPGTMPFVHSTQSETAVAKAKGNIIVAYNNSSNAIVGLDPGGKGLVFLQLLFGGYSVSQDNGATWSSAFFPPVPGSAFTFGDPALAVDANGDVYFAQLGADAKGNNTVQVNKSLDGGLHWSAAKVVAVDPGADKEWIAVGPDGVVYVTWTSFQNDGSSRLKLAISRNGGSTWSSRTIFAPPANTNPKFPQNALSFSQPTVDQITNKLYIPFLHFSSSDQDFIRIKVSDDHGATFRDLNFNIPGAPSPRLLPVTTPGDLNECGVFTNSSTEPILNAPTQNPPTQFFPNVRLTLHSGNPIGGSRTGLPRWVHATRLITQPAFAARGGKLYLAWNNSNSNTMGISNPGSKIVFIRSTDAGKTWSARKQISPARTSDRNHVLPTLAIDENANTSTVHVEYYTQHTDSSIDVDLATSTDGGNTWPTTLVRRMSTAHSHLPPTNIPLPTADNPFNTVNYDRVIAQCYALGEYVALKEIDQQVLGAWGDTRRSITQPVSKFDPISGQTHPQEDVFFQRLIE